MTSLQFNIIILDLHAPLRRMTELVRVEEDIPDSGADFFEVDLLASTLTWRFEIYENNRRC